jgi:phytoene/squalene synthetase
VKHVAPAHTREELVEAARVSIRKGSASFRAASRLFDRTTRERVWMLYAWCRACDDIADNQDHGGALGPQHDAEGRLATIRTLTELAFAGEWTGEPAFDALGQLAREVPITLTMAEDVIAGFALDAAEWRPRSETDMLRYCYHVAGAVGGIVFGHVSQATRTRSTGLATSASRSSSTTSCETWPKTMPPTAATFPSSGRWRKTSPPAS